MVGPPSASRGSGSEEARSVALQELPRKLAYMQTLWQKLLYVRWDAQALELVRRLVQEIRTLAADQGLDAAAAAARRLEQQLQVLQSRHGAPPETERGRLQGCMQRLAHALLDAHADAPPSSPVPAAVTATASPVQDHRRHICILSDDCRDNDAWLARLRHAGYELHLCAGLNELRRVMSQRRPDLLLAEVSLAQSELAGVEAIDALHSEFGAEIPVVFMAARGDLSVRLAAVRAGGLGYFLKPVDEEALLRRIDELLPQRRAHFRILIVEDEEQLAGAYALVLQQAGFVAQVLTQPLQILQVLQQFQPDLLLMDLHLPECSGSELMQLIRQDPAYDALPIIFLSGDADPARHNAVLSQGADLFLLKPIKPQQLVSAVSARIGRAHLLRQRLLWLSQRDALTGLLNYRALRSQLDRCLTDTRIRGNHPATLLYLETDQYRALRDRHGLAVLDLLLVELAGWLRMHITEPAGTLQWVMAHLGEGRFCVLLPNRDAATARDIARMLCDAVAAKSFCIGEESLALTFSIGMATPQPEYRTGLDWLSGAALACDAARRAGGGRVELQRAAASDVAEHQRHEHIARLLRAALETDGFHCVYQPIASLRGQAVERYDVLLRAHDADGHELGVENLLAVARDERLLGAIDRWVVAHVLEVIQRRAATDEQAMFFVKLSLQTLSDPSAAGWIGSSLAEAGVDGCRLVFEFNEADVVTSMRLASELSARLHALGCGIALEHFGVAPGAVQLLGHLQVDYVKLDGTLVHAITHRSDAQQRLRNLLDEAAAAGVQVIAGFVEDAASLTALWQCGVQFIQGNFLQEPDASLSFDFRDELLE